MIIKVKGLRINGGIRADKVRLVDAENNQVGIVERLFALEKSREANLDLTTSDGNITTDGVKGQLRFSTGDGNIDAHQLDGTLRANTGDGQIRLAGRFDMLDLHTGDGNIDAEVLRGSKMTSGWLVRTGDGEVMLRLPEDFAADLSIHTGDGHISVDLPVTTSGKVSESNFQGKLNGGGMVLELRSGDGNISVRKS